MLVQIQLSPPSSRISSAIHTTFLFDRNDGVRLPGAIGLARACLDASQRMILLHRNNRGIAKRLKALVFDISIS